MGVISTPRTLSGGVTPACSVCGVRLCYDISEGEYERNRTFWDEWKCEACNVGRMRHPGRLADAKR